MNHLEKDNDMPVGPGSEPEPKNEAAENDVLRKVPSEITPSQEWGERYESAKTIATSGNPDGASQEDPARPIGMTPPDNIYLQPEAEGVVLVFCSCCKAKIGRVQTVPESDTGNHAAARQEIERELSVIASEHQSICPGESSS